MAPAKQYEVEIDGKPCMVTLVQTGSKKVWTAYGESGGKRLDATGPNEQAALSKWKKLANYQANE